MPATLPVMTSRQVRNGELRHMGVRPTAAYHTQVGPGDHVAVQHVQQEPFHAERFHAVIAAVHDHGYYVTVEYRREDDGRPGVAKLFVDGPPEWGVIEFRVLVKHHRPPSARQHPGGGQLTHPENPCIKLAKKENCPACRRLYEWRPREGWPCLACRIDHADLEEAT